MPSSLKSKLNRLKTSSEPRPAPPPPALMEHEARFPADEKLFSLSPCALKRLGFKFPFEPSRALFLDTETTGLSGGAGTVAFLVGLGMQLAVLCLPPLMEIFSVVAMTGQQWLAVLGLSAAPVLVCELEKRVRR